MEKIIWTCSDYSIFRVGADRLHDIARFVVTQNYNHHSSSEPIPDTARQEITFNYIRCLKQLEQNEQSTTLLDSINLIHSNKMVSNWYKLLLTNSDSILIQNIYKNPRLLYSNEYRSYFDTISSNRFQNIKFLIFNKNDAHDAKAKAKLGRIKLWAGDTIGASIFLSESLRLLPNLIEPRNYMSKIDKANANLYKKQYSIITKHRPDTVINEICIEEYYKNNFTFWYGGTVSSTFLIF